MRADPDLRRAIERVLDEEPALSGMTVLDRMDLADRCAQAVEQADVVIGVEAW